MNEFPKLHYKLFKFSVKIDWWNLRDELYSFKCILGIESLTSLIYAEFDTSLLVLSKILSDICVGHNKDRFVFNLERAIIFTNCKRSDIRDDVAEMSVLLRWHLFLVAFFGAE